MQRVLFSLFLLVLSPAVFAKEGISLVKGETKTVKLSFTPSHKVTCSDFNVVSIDLNPMDRKITFKGLMPGNVSVTVKSATGSKSQKYKITVLNSD